MKNNQNVFFYSFSFFFQQQVHFFLLLKFLLSSFLLLTLSLVFATFNASFVSFITIFGIVSSQFEQMLRWSNSLKTMPIRVSKNYLSLTLSIFQTTLFISTILVWVIWLWNENKNLFVSMLSTSLTSVFILSMISRAFLWVDRRCKIRSSPIFAAPVFQFQGPNLDCSWKNKIGKDWLVFKNNNIRYVLKRNICISNST